MAIGSKAENVESASSAAGTSDGRSEDSSATTGTPASSHWSISTAEPSNCLPDSKDWEANELLEIDADSGEHRPRFDRGNLPNKAEAFVAAVRDGQEPPTTALDGLRVTAVTEAAYESERADGTFVEIDPADVALGR